MRAMVLDGPGKALELRDIPKPECHPRDILVKVGVCGVCRTDLHVVDGELTEPTLPLVPGHQIVGTVEGFGSDVSEATRWEMPEGSRVGIPWLGGTCGECFYCRSNAENLCDSAVFTGYQRNGGYAEYAVADARFCFPIPDDYGNSAAAPLLCAGLIGYRSFRMAEAALEVAKKANRKPRLGLYGFGAAAHIIAQISIHHGHDVYAFVSPGDTKAEEFARGLGAIWAGPSVDRSPEELDAAIIFAPVGSLVPSALESVRKGGSVVCAGIHMSDIPSFPYDLLWSERSICSVANLTRDDGIDFFAVAPRVPVETTVTEYALEEANRALDDLRAGRIEGAAVLVI